MSKQIIIAEQHRIAAVFSEDQIQELIVAKGNLQVGDVYLGIVENILPGIDAAFVNIGDSERNGFIHVSDLGPLRLRKSAGSITELLAPQQKVLVQIMKEPTGNKGPRLTGNVSLPGRYLVLMPFGRGVNLSSRIRNESERNRLRALAILIKPAGMGLLVRTEAQSMDEEAILEDLETLQKQWENVQQEAMTTRAPSLLNRDDDFIQRVLRDVYSTDVNRIVVDSHTGLKRVKQHLINWSGGKTPQGVLVDHHRERTSILEYFRVNAAIREALKPRVDLPSGGYIIIERTEALTVIDVNSGSFTRSATARETVLWTNCEAATEIARQLRLRNIAGVIIIDFIDMDSHRDKLQVLEQFNKALRADKARPQIAQLSELGLVELTRKRQGQNIYELFGRTCPTCGGLGHLVHLPGETDTVDAAEAIEALRVSPAYDPRSESRSDSRNDSRSESRNDSRSDSRSDSRAESRTPQLREAWEKSNDDLDLDASQDLQELNLTNHPSYQERNRGDNRRRRRSRLKVGEPSGRNDLPKLDSDTEVEVARGIDEPAASLPSRQIRGGRDGREVREVRDGREVQGQEARGQEVRDGREAREARPEKPDRGTRVTRREKPAAEPPQVISVEMTLEEQDVYALMGISPLVLSSEAVKDPKTTIVSVILPGEAPRPSTGLPMSAIVSTAETDAEVDLLDSHPIEVQVTAAEPLDLPGASDSMPRLIPRMTEPMAAIAAEEPLEESASSAADTARRRRRRRSSVGASDAD